MQICKECVFVLLLSGVRHEIIETDRIFGLLKWVGEGIGTLVGLRNSLMGGKRFCSSDRRPFD